MNIDLKGKLALVTGGSRGIGRAIALALADSGCDTVINYQSSDDAAAEVATAIQARGVRGKAYKADISDSSQCDAMVANIAKEFGAVDILVNNAGINRDRSFLKMTRAMWDEVLGVNLNGPFNVTHSLLPEMVSKGWGRIVNITSMGGQTGNFGQANYAVTKGGLIAFTMTLARELARKGVTVNAVSPGYTETDMTKGMPEAAVDQVKALIPVGRMGTPEEMAAAVVFLASPQAAYITGQVLGVNGGDVHVAATVPRRMEALPLLSPLHVRPPPSFPVLEPDEAARLISHLQTVGFSGFTPAGAAKAIPRAIAAYAEEEHRIGNPFQIGVLTGASTGHSLDGALARAEAVLWRAPYQSNPDLRDAINTGRIRFFDMHLSIVPQYVRYGYLGNIDWAVVEAADVTADGEIVLTTSVGASSTFLQCADNILIELNASHRERLRGFHDLYEPADPPNRREIPIYSVADRIGSPVVKVNPAKIRGIVHTDEPDEARTFKEGTDITRRIGENVADFLASEIRRRRLPRGFLPVQSGVGNIANAVLHAMGAHPDIPAFEMYSEVLQDSVIDLMLEGKVKFASATSLSLSPAKMRLFYEDLEFFRKRIVLRPQEITNSPEIARRLGVISINTALEVDIFGNINSTHVLGRDIMNGIGGSGDFTRSAYLSIFVCPSTVRDGRISTIVPHCSHIDHSEHSVQAVVTEQGTAILRCKAPKDRAHALIERCAHTDYRDDLNDYFDSATVGYTPQTFGLAFAMHQKFLETGDMRDVDWGNVSRVSALLRSARGIARPHVESVV